MDKQWTREEIIDLLNRSDLAVCRAIAALNNRQTEAERHGGYAPPNGVGFNKWDAVSGFLPGLARQLESKGSLSKKQINAARQKVVRYARQLTQIANSKRRNHEEAQNDV